jgi:hypothetical protein
MKRSEMIEEIVKIIKEAGGLDTAGFPNELYFEADHLLTRLEELGMQPPTLCKNYFYDDDWKTEDLHEWERE